MVPFIEKPVHWFALQMDWFLYDDDLHHERVNQTKVFSKQNIEVQKNRPLKRYFDGLFSIKGLLWRSAFAELSKAYMLLFWF